MKIDNPFYDQLRRPVYLVAKPIGAACNLRCEYCYYLEKSILYGNKSYKQVMTEEMLELFVKNYIEAQASNHCVFNWHGGETLLRNVDFYKKAIELQKKYGNGMVIENTIQTNGTLLDDRWCRFFKENNFLVGISIDGPEDFHNEYRIDNSGYGSFKKVLRGIELLKKHGVEWNALAVVNDYNADYPEEFYEFFKQIGCKHLQFTPIVERINDYGDGRKLASPSEKAIHEVTPFSVTPEQWGEFLCRVFDVWVKNDVGEIFVQLFDSTLANWVGVAPGICSLAETCGHAGVIEFNGDVYSCDHFVFPEYKLGNIKDKSVVEMMTSERQIAFGASKKASLPVKCKKCKYLFACNGECPKNRFAISPDGESGLNYLCEGYFRFFRHVSPYMDFMKNELEAGRPPSNVMKSPLVQK